MSTRTCDFEAPRRKRVDLGRTKFMDVPWASLDELEAYRSEVLGLPPLESYWDLLKFDIAKADPEKKVQKRLETTLSKALAKMTPAEREQLAFLLSNGS